MGKNWWGKNSGEKMVGKKWWGKGSGEKVGGEKIFRGNILGGKRLVGKHLGGETS